MFQISAIPDLILIDLAFSEHQYIHLIGKLQYQRPILKGKILLHIGLVGGIKR